MDKKYAKLDEKCTKLETAISLQKSDVTSEISKLEQSIVVQKVEIANEITCKIENNAEKLDKLMEENTHLKRECGKVQNRLTRLEMNQLNSDVILMGLAEQPWENYKITKQRVIDTIAATLWPIEGDNASARDNLVDIAYCSRVGRAHPNYDRPISIMLQRQKDKELLMLNKKHLPTGIYANDEFPIHVKRISNCLRSILRMAKGMQEYKDKCKLEGVKLVINRVE